MTQRVLFICTHNSARSQMAQGLLKTLAGGRYEAFSAGTHPTEVSPLAVTVMDEVGVDIRGQGTHTLGDYAGQTFDVVVTVCDAAALECPSFAGAKRQLHWGFADPKAVVGDEATRLMAFREARDAIMLKLESWLAEQGALERRLSGGAEDGG